MKSSFLTAKEPRQSISALAICASAILTATTRLTLRVTALPLRDLGRMGVISFWAMLAGHAWQLALSWWSQTPVFDPVFMLLLWTVATSFVAVGASSVPRDVYIIGSRFPAAVLAMLSMVQAVKPQFGLVEVLLVLAFNGGCLTLLLATSSAPGLAVRLRRLSRIAFVTAYLAGMPIQCMKFYLNGSEGASPLFWIAMVVSGAIWAAYNYRKGDDLIAYVFVFSAVLSATLLIQCVV